MRYIPPNSRYHLYTHLCILSCHRGFGMVRPNYGDGSVYWSVAGLDRGALPLQSFALNHALLLWGHPHEAAQRLEYYFNVYLLRIIQRRYALYVHRYLHYLCRLYIQMMISIV